MSAETFESNSAGEQKQKAALRAVELVESGMVLGLGSGSTAALAVREIGRLLAAGELEKICGIPTSNETAAIAKEAGIPLTDFSSHRRIDLTIDGADEIDPQFNMIKGGGGALLREKIVAQASDRYVIIVDQRKISTNLGTQWHIPIEVIEFGYIPEIEFLSSLGVYAKIRRTADGRVFYTDEHNMIIDANFGIINNPPDLEKRLHERAGMVENGLFIGMATDIICAGSEGIEHIKSTDSKGIIADMFNKYTGVHH